MKSLDSKNLRSSEGDACLGIRPIRSQSNKVLSVSEVDEVKKRFGAASSSLLWPLFLRPRRGEEGASLKCEVSDVLMTAFPAVRVSESTARVTRR